MPKFVAAWQLRQRFAFRLSDMYRKEVPAYGTLIALVNEINNGAAASDEFKEERLGSERHGAIRLAHPAELSLIRRALAIMEMHPVGYYDLAAAGLPVHSTAFRPISTSELEKNAFRLFTSLVRLDQITSDGLRSDIEKLVSKRQIISSKTLELIQKAERNGGLDEADADMFILGLMDTFRWRGEALTSAEVYQATIDQHPLVADVVCFPNPHINHLTPRVLDIDLAQTEMAKLGLRVKEKIEGPPRRNCPILLRQTAFRALDEKVTFPDPIHGPVEGVHTARFGEIEARGAALTTDGMNLYDRSMRTGSFQNIPDDWDYLRSQGLAWFRYRCVSDARGTSGGALEEFINDGAIVATPITYEDFLPVSAAGIFRSNLKQTSDVESSKASSRLEFESALGATVLDAQTLYRRESEASVRNALAETQSVEA
jgi:uncharacterized glyoxalase superfamily metalloenzyme YdcJ